MLLTFDKVTGNMQIKGSYGQISDERVKNIINKNQIHKDLFMSIEMIDYFRIDAEKNSKESKLIHYGVGAQTLQFTLQKLNYKNTALINYDEEYDKYSVNYTELLMLSVPVVQQHEREINNLKQQNQQLRNQLEQLKQQIQEIKNLLK